VSSWGTPRGNGCTSVVGVWAAGLAFVAATTLIAACHPVDDAGTDGSSSNPCAEIDNPPPGCEP
jgi:hypothetical protein